MSALPRCMTTFWTLSPLILRQSNPSSGLLPISLRHRFPVQLTNSWYVILPSSGHIILPEKYSRASRHRYRCCSFFFIGACLTTGHAEAGEEKNDDRRDKEDGAGKDPEIHSGSGAGEDGNEREAEERKGEHVKESENGVAGVLFSSAATLLGGSDRVSGHNVGIGEWMCVRSGGSESKRIVAGKKCRRRGLAIVSGEAVVA